MRLREGSPAKTHNKSTKVPPTSYLPYLWGIPPTDTQKPNPKDAVGPIEIETWPNGLDSSIATYQMGRGENSSSCGLMWAKTALTYLTSPPAQQQRRVWVPHINIDTTPCEPPFLLYLAKTKIRNLYPSGRTCF